MSDQAPMPENLVMQWITSKWITKPIAVVTELGIADLLNDGPKDVTALARDTNTHAPTLYRILRALSTVGIFTETGDQVFASTPLAQCLCSNALGPIARMFLSHWHDKAWNGLSHTLKTGKPGFDHMFGKPSFDWFEENPLARAVLDEGQGAKALGIAKAVTDAYNFSHIGGTICDIGGGKGVFLGCVLTRYPELHGIVADLPGALESAEKTITATHLNHRCKTVSHDFFQTAPPACDAYFMVNILHDWDDDTCARILGNIKESMTEDTRLWIIEYLLEPGPDFCVAKLLDIEVLVMSGGRERTVREYTALLNAAGLKLDKIIPLEGGPAMLECTPG